MQKNRNVFQVPPFIQHICSALLLCIATALTYRPTLHFPFHFDDIVNIQKHFYIRHHGFFSLWFSGSRWISYWLNALHYSIDKFDTFSYRLGNVCIHTINGLLLFCILTMALPRSSSSFCKRYAAAIASFTTLLFLLHPVQTQTVSYVIQGQLEGLACMGILGTVACFLYHCYTERVLHKYIITCLLFIVAALSCGTKEIAVITPALVLLVDWFFVARGCLTSLKSRLLLHVALFALVIGLYIKFLKPSFFTDIIGLQKVAKNNFGNIITHNGQNVIHPWPFFISQFKVILHYILIFIWPFSISVEYDWMLCKSFFSIDCVLPFLALLGLGIACMRLLYKQPTHIIGFGALWFFLSIAPRSSIIPSPELLVDYKTYTASVGWLLIISCACIKGITLLMQAAQAKQDLLQTKSGHALFLMLSIIPFSYMTRSRNHVWSSGLELWMNTMQRAPNKARAYNNYAFELAHTHQRYSEAIPYFKRAARMDRQYPEPLNNLAVCYSKLEQIDKAIVALQQSLRIYPQSPEGHSNLALFYIEKKEYAAAEQHLLTALHLRPYYGSAYINLGTMYTALNKPLEALDAYKKACTIADLDNEYGYQVYARAAFSQQHYTEAIWGLEKALAHNPGNKEALFSLAGCYLRSQQIAKARALYEQLLVKHSDDKRIQFNLGETYFAEENYTQAFAYFSCIDPEKDRLPQTRLRLAECYEKSGNLISARNELERAMCNNTNTSSTYINAHTSLNRLNAYYTT